MVLETSTDPDDGYQMVGFAESSNYLYHSDHISSNSQGPPSPCDVEFANANVIIEGKSSIRTRTRDVKVSFHLLLWHAFQSSFMGKTHEKYK